MRFTTLGGTGLRVSELALGTMRMPHSDLAESRRIFAAYADAGGNFLDTADKYGAGAAERLVRDLVGDARDRYVVGTKYTLERDPDDLNAAGNQRKNLVAALEQSLQRLGTDRVDVLWVHARDTLTPVAEVMRALDDQVRAGKVLYTAVSDWPAWEVAQANTLARERGWTPFAALQLEYSLAERTAERELLPMAAGLGLTPCAWSPLGGGRLARPEEGTVLESIARETGGSPAQVALAWLRTRTPAVIPIVGASRGSQLRNGLGALDLRLHAGQLEALDRASAIEHGFPHEFLARDAVQDVVYGTRRADLL